MAVEGDNCSFSCISNEWVESWRYGGSSGQEDKTWRKYSKQKLVK